MSKTSPDSTVPAGAPTAGAATRPAPRPGTAPGEAQMKLDTANLKSTYCNMCSANTTREEVVLNFGINQNWDRGQGGAMDVALEHRIILSPFAAKRLSRMLDKLIGEYETRYGTLE